MSFDKITRVLPEFKPQWDARKGAEQLYTAYRSAGSRSRNSRCRYQRISHIKMLIRDGILDADCVDGRGPSKGWRSW